MNDTNKIRKKIYIPLDSSFNYTGLVIGPKGSNQKRLEMETGCKILVRGRGSKKEGQEPETDDDDDQHVLIVGDNTDQVKNAVNQVHRIIFAGKFLYSQ